MTSLVQQAMKNKYLLMMTLCEDSKETLLMDSKSVHLLVR